MRQPTTEANDTVSRAEFVAMQAEYDRKLAALTGTLTQSRRPRPWQRLVLMLMLVTLLALVPVSIRAANPFNDLTGSVHDPNIDLIYNAGITTGCVPNVSYCPTDNVTREQMASFLARTAGLGTNPPVVNAKTAQTATTATSATTVGGYAPNALIRAAQSPPSPYTRDTDEFTVISIFNNSSVPLDPIASVAITAPGAGFVVVNATVGVSIEPSSTGGTSSNTVGFARLRDTSVVSTGAASPLLSTATGNGSQATTLGPTYIFPVAAGAHTFVLEAQKSGTGTVKVFDGVVTALFVPFGSGGAGTLEEGQP
jgi:hypothetical protein